MDRGLVDSLGHGSDAITHKLSVFIKSIFQVFCFLFSSFFIFFILRSPQDFSIDNFSTFIFRDAHPSGVSFFYVLKLSIFKSLMLSIFFGPFCVSFVYFLGRGSTQKKTSRGTILIDMTQKNADSFWAVRLLISFFVTSIFFVLVTGSAGLCNMLQVALSLMASKIEPINAIISKYGHKGYGWYVVDSLGKGFYAHGSVYRGLSRTIYGGNLGLLISSCLLLFVTTFFISRIFLAKIKRRSQRQLSEDIVIGGVQIPRELETQHFLISGSTGSGKTVAINSIIKRVRARGEPAILLDMGGTLIERFYDPARDIILNPRDIRGSSWSVWGEVKSDVDYVTFGKSLFPHSGGNDAFWSDSAAMLFAHIAQALKERDMAKNSMMYEILSSATMGELADLVRGTTSERYVSGDGGAMSQSVLATTVSRLEFFRTLKDDVPNFSIRDWVKSGGDSFVFISADDRDLSTSRPLMSLWLEIAAMEAMTLSEKADKRTWFFLDELAAMQRLPALMPLLARGRKFGAVCVVGLQAMSQFHSLYGKDDALTLLSQPQNCLFLRTVEAETARWVEDQVGKDEHRETEVSYSMSSRDSTSYSSRKTRESVVMASEIAQLDNLTGYLRVRGLHGVRKVRYDIDHLPIVAPAFLPC